MKKIDIEKWARRDVYKMFVNNSFPICSISVRLDVTKLYEYSKRTGTSFFINFVYVSAHCLNQVDEMKLRFYNKEVVQFDSIIPSYIVKANDDTIVTCATEMCDTYSVFYQNVKADMEQVKEKTAGKLSFGTERAETDYMYISCLPWVDLTSVTNPYNLTDMDNCSIPRITWSKYVLENGKYTMFFNVAVHHALIDGQEISKYCNLIQSKLDDIERFIK